MLDGLPGFIADDIAALLLDLPLPASGDTPGMSVDEAIEVLHTTCYKTCCILSCYVTWQNTTVQAATSMSDDDDDVCVVQWNAQSCESKGCHRHLGRRR